MCLPVFSVVPCNLFLELYYLDQYRVSPIPNLSSTIVDTVTWEMSLSIRLSRPRAMTPQSWKLPRSWWITSWWRNWQDWNHDRKEVLRVARYPNPIFKWEVVFHRSSIHMNTRFHRKAFRATILLACFRGLSLSRIYPTLWHTLLPLHASPLLHWRLCLSWDCTISSKYPFQHHSSPFADRVPWRAGVDNKFSFLRLKTLTHVGTYFPKVRRMLLILAPSNFYNTFLAKLPRCFAGTLLCLS